MNRKYVIVYGDIMDIDYLNVAGPFDSQAEAEREGKRLTAEGKLPDEEANSGEQAWRVYPLGAPDELHLAYDE